MSLTLGSPLSRPLRRYHRPVSVDLGILQSLDIRTAEGYRLAIDWGQPDADGFYTPTLTTTDDGYVLIHRDALAILEERAGGVE